MKMFPSAKAPPRRSAVDRKRNAISPDSGKVE
jgi:hypothetical protein